jgi:hypothetical protein
MLGEFGSVIEGKGSDQSVVERLEPGQEPADGWFGSLARLLGEEKDAGLSLVSGEDGLAIFSKQHEVGLPVSCLPSGIGGLARSPSRMLSAPLVGEGDVSVMANTIASE